MLGFVSGAVLLFVAGELDVTAGVVGETRVGEGPLQAGQPPTAGVIGVMTPNVAFELRRPELDLRLEYGLRVFTKEPNGSQGMSSRIAPLLLHVANVFATDRPSETVTLTGKLAVAVGEPDYSYLSFLLGTQAPAGMTSGGMATPGGMAPQGGTTPQGALPAVQNVLLLSSSLGALVELSRIWAAGAIVQGDHRRPIEGTNPIVATNSPTAPFPQQSMVRLDPAATAHLSRRDDLLLVSSIWYQTYASTTASAGGDFLTVAAEVGWRTHLSPRYNMRLLGGVANLRTLARRPVLGTPSAPAVTPTTSDSNDNAIIPIGTAEIQGRVFRGEGIAVNGSLMGIVDYYADPTLAVMVPHGALSTQWTFFFASDWTAGIEGAFGTSLRASPIGPPPLPGTRSAVETTASASLPVRHRYSENLTLEFGVRWVDRAPHLRAVDFGFYQRDLWAYVLFRANSRRTPRFVPP